MNKKIVVAVGSIMLATATAVNAATVTVADMISATANAWQNPKTIRMELEKDPTPVAEEKGNLTTKHYDPKVFKVNKFRPHYVYYAEKECWLNLSVVPAIEVQSNTIYLYYVDSKKMFKVHFRTTRECQIASNLLMQGVDAELPPYYVTEE